MSKKKKREATADRMTFAAVLEIISENAPSNVIAPFDCDSLR